MILNFLKDFIICYLEILFDVKGRFKVLGQNRSPQPYIEATSLSRKNYFFNLKAICSNPILLKYIPDELKTYNMCLVAVKKRGIALKYVPYNYKTKELLLTAIANQTKNDKSVLEHVPLYFRKYEICLKSVFHNGNSLKDVPIDLQDEKLCMEAVSNTGLAIRFVKEQSYRICERAIIDTSLVYSYIHQQFKTPELCLLMLAENVKTNSEVFKLVDICPNPDFNITVKNLQNMQNRDREIENNKKLVKNTINSIS